MQSYHQQQQHQQTQPTTLTSMASSTSNINIGSGSDENKQQMVTTSVPMQPSPSPSPSPQHQQSSSMMPSTSLPSTMLPPNFIPSYPPPGFLQQNGFMPPPSSIPQQPQSLLQSSFLDHIQTYIKDKNYMAYVDQHDAQPKDEPKFDFIEIKQNTPIVLQKINTDEMRHDYEIVKQMNLMDVANLDSIYSIMDLCLETENHNKLLYAFHSFREKYMEKYKEIFIKYPSVAQMVTVLLYSLIFDSQAGVIGMFKDKRAQREVYNSLGVSTTFKFTIPKRKRKKQDVKVDGDGNNATTATTTNEEKSSIEESSSESAKAMKKLKIRQNREKVFLEKHPIKNAKIFKCFDKLFTLGSFMCDLKCVPLDFITLILNVSSKSSINSPDALVLSFTDKNIILPVIRTVARFKSFTFELPKNVDLYLSEIYPSAKLTQFSCKFGMLQDGNDIKNIRDSSDQCKLSDASFHVNDFCFTIASKIDVSLKYMNSGNNTTTALNANVNASSDKILFDLKVWSNTFYRINGKDLSVPEDGFSNFVQSDRNIKYQMKRNMELFKYKRNIVEKNKSLFEEMFSDDEDDYDYDIKDFENIFNTNVNTKSQVSKCKNTNASDNESDNDENLNNNDSNNENDDDNDSTKDSNSGYISNKRMKI